MNAIRAEWGKVWSVRAPAGCLAGSVLLVLLVAASLANDFVVDVNRGDAKPGTMPVLDAVTPGVQLGLALVAVFAMLPSTTEYGTGSIRSTLWAQPVRSQVLNAKLAVVVATAVPVGMLTGLLSRLAVSLVLGPAAPPGDGVTAVPLLLTAARVGILFGLGAVIAVGVATALRSAIGTLSTCFVLLAGLAVLPERTAAWTPAGAAAEFLSGSHAVYPPITGMLVMLAWAGAAYGLGRWMFERRDA